MRLICIVAGEPSPPSTPRSAPVCVLLEGDRQLWGLHGWPIGRWRAVLQGGARPECWLIGRGAGAGVGVLRERLSAPPPRVLFLVSQPASLGGSQLHVCELCCSGLHRQQPIQTPDAPCWELGISQLTSGLLIAQPVHLAPSQQRMHHLQVSGV